MNGGNFVKNSTMSNVVTDRELVEFDKQTRQKAARFVSEKMREKNISKHELSVQSGVGWHAIKRVINGEIVKSSTLSKIIRALGGSMIFI